MKVFWIVLACILGAVLLYVFTVIISSLFVNTKKEYSEGNSYYRFLLNSSTAAGMKIMRLKYHKEGLDKVPEDSRFLFVTNHRSNFDPIISWDILRKYKLNFITKADNFNVPVFGRLIRRCGFMSIDRENNRKALETVERAADMLDRDEASIGAYPEGTRNKVQEEMLPFRNGLFKIAQKANVPIVVGAVLNTDKIHKNYPLHRTHIYFRIVDTIPAEKVTSMRTNEIGELVRQEISDALEEMKKEDRERIEAKHKK